MRVAATVTVGAIAREEKLTDALAPGVRRGRNARVGVATRVAEPAAPRHEELAYFVGRGRSGWCRAITR